MGRVTKHNLVAVMTYQKPSGDDVAKFERIRVAAIAFAEVILAETPECADATAAVLCVRQARMWANSAIALGGEV